MEYGKRVDEGRVDQRLEGYVAAVYRALGYQTSPDVLVQGNQVDVLASRTMAGLVAPIRLHLEVKHTGKPHLPLSEVNEFITVARALRGEGEVDRSVLVSSAPFTRNSELAARSYPYIELITVEQLENHLLPLESLNRIVTTWESSALSSVYIDLKVTQIEGQLATPVAARCSDLVRAALSTPFSAVVLLADYGAGKTTTLRRLNARLARSRLEATSTLVPFFIELKRLEHYTNIEDFILDAYRVRFGTELPIEHIMSMITSGRFFLLLDGFDEITLRADSARRLGLLLHLSPLIHSPCPTILTSRPAYFLTRSEIGVAMEAIQSGVGNRYGLTSSMDLKVRSVAQRVGSMLNEALPFHESDASPEYMVFDLGLLEEREIISYLEANEARFNEIGLFSWQEVKEFVESIYDLSDLMHRPILLEMIVSTILEGHLDPRNTNTSFGSAGLYEMYTSLTLDIDVEKAESRREVLNPDSRKAFAEDCAELMRIMDALELTPQNVEHLAEQRFGSTGLGMAEILTDLRTCSFLTIADDGALRFIHRSFQEFFVARRICRSPEGAGLLLLRFELSSEILDFVGAFGAFDDAHYQVLQRLMESDDSSRTHLRNNAATALVSARQVTSGMDLDGVHLQSNRRKALRIELSSLRASRISVAETREVAFDDCVLDLEILQASPGMISCTNCWGTIRLSGSASRVVASASKQLRLEFHDADPSSSAVISRCTCSIDLRISIRDVEIDTSDATFERELPVSTIAKNCRLTISAPTRDEAKLDATLSSLFLLAGRHGGLAGTFRRCRIEVRGNRAYESDPLRFALDDCILILDNFNNSIDISQSSARNVILVGALPILPEDRSAFTGICLRLSDNDYTPSNRASSRQIDKSSESIRWWDEAEGFVVAAGGGRSFVGLGRDLAEWMTNEGYDEQPDYKALLALLVRYECPPGLAATTVSAFEQARRNHRWPARAV